MKLFLKNFLLIGFFLTSFSYPLKAQENNNQHNKDFLFRYLLFFPSWENTIEITFRDKKKYHTFALEKKNLLLGLKKMSLKKMGLKTIKKLLFLYPLKQT